MANIIDIQKEILLHIESERTEAHSIDWRRFKAIGDALQELIISLAEAKTGHPIDKLNESLSLEAKASLGGSFTPAFKIKGEGALLIEDGLMDEINQDFNQVAEIAGSGNYKKVLQLYPDKKDGAGVGASLYKFQNSFDGMPVSFAQRKRGKVTNLYPIKRFKKIDRVEIIKYLPEEKKRQKPLIVTEGLAKVRLSKSKDGKVSKKITEIYQKNTVASVKLNKIEFEDREYVFKFPLLIEEIIEDGTTYLENELLDIYAVGEDMTNAVLDFSENFDYLYRRLNSMENDQLGKRMLMAKDYLKLIVKEN